MLLSSVVTALTTLCLSGQSLAVRNRSQEAYESTGISACDALLAAGFGNKVLLPAEPAYEASIAQYYTTSSRLRPWCIFQPLDTRDVSVAVSTLVKAGRTGESGGIAVRAGGHSAAAFASGIVNGVTFDLGMMNNTSYDTSTRLASIEPGARWGSVYTALLPYNVTVSGGRDANVGVGGLLLGGGISHYTSRVGMSCDDIVNYEVVLANSTILNANKTHHSDLWKALKGGTNNFGIVTRFDKTAIAGQEIWFSQRKISSDYSNDYVDALAEFTRANNAHAGDAVVGFLTYEPANRSISIILEEINTYAVPNGTSFAELNKIPAKESKNTIIPLAKAATEYPGGEGGAGSSLTFKNDARILRRAVELHAEAVSFLSANIGPEKFTTTCFFEPIPASVQRIGKENGGNMLGLPAGQDLIIWDAWFSVGGSGANLAIVHEAMRRLSAQISDYAKRVGGDVELVYANYADASQNVIGSYPKESKQLMKAVAEAYDPAEFFQERVSGGFKLPKSS